LEIRNSNVEIRRKAIVSNFGLSASGFQIRGV